MAALSSFDQHLDQLDLEDETGAVSSDAHGFANPFAPPPLPFDWREALEAAGLNLWEQAFAWLPESDDPIPSQPARAPSPEPRREQPSDDPVTIARDSGSPTRRRRTRCNAHGGASCGATIPTGARTSRPTSPIGASRSPTCWSTARSLNLRGGGSGVRGRKQPLGRSDREAVGVGSAAAIRVANERGALRGDRPDPRVCARPGLPRLTSAARLA